MEIWKDIKGYEGYYQVSNLGRVKSTRYSKDKILKTFRNGSGYDKIDLKKNAEIKRFFVHKLVIEAFIPNPENKPQGNHINGIKTDNRAENLEWVTNRENTIHALELGLCKGRKRKTPKKKKLRGNLVLNTQTGIFYDNIKKASETIPFSRRHLTDMVNGIYTNRTYFILA